MSSALRPFVGSLHAKNALVVALALAGAMPYGWRAVASVACGGGIQIVNLIGLDRGLRRVAQRAAGAAGSVGGARALLFVRFTLLVAAVGAVMRLAPVEVLPFVVGLSSAIPAALWHGASSARAAGKL